MAVKENQNKLMTTVTTAQPVKLKVPKSIQTETFTFGVSPKGTPDAIAHDKQSQKLVKQSSGQKLPDDVRKARRLTPRVKGNYFTKSDTDQISGKL